MSWGKIIDSTFDEDTGYSYVEFETKYGVICGEAYCHPNDMDIMNSWDGFRICELRCYLEFERLNMIALRERYLATEHVLNTLAWNYEGDVLDSLAQQAKAAHKLYKEAREKYYRHRKNLGDTIQNILRQRREIRSHEKFLDNN